MSSGGAVCVDCHKDEAGKIFRPDNTQCTNCHEAEYAEMHTEWQRTYQTLIKEVADAVRVRKQESLAPQEKQELASIEQFIGKLRTDGSKGVHNFVFMEEYLTATLEKINKRQA